jgi:hypothetical protein
MIEKIMLYAILVAVHRSICSQGACVYCLKLDVPAYSMRHGKRNLGDSSQHGKRNLGDSSQCFTLQALLMIGDSSQHVFSAQPVQ